MDDTEYRAAAHALLDKMLPGAITDHPGLGGSGFASDLGAQALECVFGRVWVRPGLDLRSRSLVTLAILIATQQWTEVRVHAGAAMNNGLTREELEEVVIQSAPYAGYPVAAHAAKVMSELLDGESAWL
jgi:alkylhydroperoxidase/carboxymuconolactone decarboxylase family protein YurZ